MVVFVVCERNYDAKLVFIKIECIVNLFQRDTGQYLFVVKQEAQWATSLPLATLPLYGRSKDIVSCGSGELKKEHQFVELSPKKRFR